MRRAEMRFTLGIKGERKLMSYEFKTGETYQLGQVPFEDVHPSLCCFKSKIYAIGGTNVDGSASQRVRIFDLSPKKRTWLLGKPLPEGRSDLSSIVLDDHIYAIGGSDERTMKSSSFQRLRLGPNVYEYWESLPPLPKSREAVGVGSLLGCIYAVGGKSSKAVDVFNPCQNTWQTSVPLPQKTSDMSVASVNSRLYAVGGRTSDHVPSRECFALDPRMSYWTPIDSMSQCLYNGSAVTIGKSLYSIGMGPDWTPTIEKYECRRNRWVTQSCSLPQAGDYRYVAFKTT